MIHVSGSVNFFESQVAPKYEYNGEKLTEYEATQKQRYIERKIRKYKREVVEGYSSKPKKSGKSEDKSKRIVAKGEKSGIIEMYRGKGIDVTSDSRISSKTIKQVKKATKKVTSDFKALESYSEPIVFGDVYGGLANNSYDPKTGLNIITLRIAGFANPDSLLEKLKRDFISGDSYETGSIQSLVAHEMGHNAHIVLALKRTHLPYGVPLTAEQYVAFVNEYNKIRQEIYVAAFNDESLVEIKELCVSELGRSTENNANELIAQSFGNYYYGRKNQQLPIE